MRPTQEQIEAAALAMVEAIRSEEVGRMVEIHIPVEWMFLASRRMAEILNPAMVIESEKP